MTRSRTVIEAPKACSQKLGNTHLKVRVQVPVQDLQFLGGAAHSHQQLFIVVGWNQGIGPVRVIKADLPVVIIVLNLIHLGKT